MPTINVTGKGGGQTLDQARIKFSADQAAKMEFNLRKTLNTYSLREEKKLEDEKLRAIRQANRESLMAEKQATRERQRAEKEQKREEFRMKRESERAAIREERQAVQDSRRFWRDLSIGGIVGAISGGAGAQGFARMAGSVMGGGVAGLAGASRYSAGIIADIVGEVMGLVVNPLGAAGAAAAPAYAYQNSAFALARAARMRGGAVESVFAPYAHGASAFGPNVGVQPPEWMKRLGMTPEMGQQSLQQFGIPVRGDMGKFSENMRMLSLQSGMSNLPGGSAEAMMRQMTGLGLTSPTAGAPISEPSRAMLTVLTDANTKGLDNSKLLMSMESSLDILAKAGTPGISVSAIRDLMQGGMAFGTPAGVSGAAAVESAQGLAANFSNVLQNPMMTIALMQQANRYGGLKTQKNIQSFLGDRAYGALSSSAGGRAIIQNALQLAQSGQTAGAINLLAPAIAGDPQRAAELAMPLAREMAGGQQGFTAGIVRSMTGLSVADSQRLAWGVGSRGGRGLQRTPMSEDKAKAFLKAIGLPWSSAGRSAAGNARIGGARNSMHLTEEAIDIPVPKNLSPEQQQAWANNVIGKIKGSGVPYSELFMDRVHGANVHWGWRPKMGKGGKPLGNIPMSGIPMGGGNVGIQQPEMPPSAGDQATIAASNLNEAYLTAGTLVKVMGTFNNAVSAGARALGDFDRALGKVLNTMSAHRNP